MPLLALGRDLDGRYANSPLRPWFDQLKSRNGPCCSNADGYVVEDADWEAKNGHYRVRLPEEPDSKVMVWIDVPDNSVITEPNKAERMIERDKVACIIGETSSASCLTIAQVAQRNKVLYINTGGNSDALRGSDCKRYTFHVESQNSMYVKSVGRSFLRNGLVKGRSGTR